MAPGEIHCYDRKMQRPILLSCLVFGMGVSLARGGISLNEGEPLPDFKLPAAGDGKLMSVSDFRGSKLMLHLFASW